MWLKWVGGMITFGTCVWLGRKKGQRLGEREEQLQGFLQLCQRIETEISYGQTMLPQILQHSRLLPSPIGEIAAETGSRLSLQTGETLSCIWDKVLTIFSPRLVLKPEDVAVVKTLGSDLGLTYSTEQMKKLQLIALRLREQEQAARQERLKMERVWQALGWCGGGMLVLVLI